jgi:hypothetical protein
MAITKPAGIWTYEDLSSLPDDGRRYEIIEGELFELPSPNWAHIAVVMNLILLLGPIVQSLGGRLATAPADVFFEGAEDRDAFHIVQTAAGDDAVISSLLDGAAFPVPAIFAGIDESEG